MSEHDPMVLAYLLGVRDPDGRDSETAAEILVGLTKRCGGRAPMTSHELTALLQRLLRKGKVCSQSSRRGGGGPQVYWTTNQMIQGKNPVLRVRLVGNPGGPRPADARR